MNTHRILRRSATFICAAGLLALGGACASMGWSSDQSALIKQASFDHNCAEDKVKVLRSMEGGLGVASFVLDVCGSEKKYKRMGASYFDESKGVPAQMAGPAGAPPSKT